MSASPTIDGGYFPSCVVNMTLRFDETLQVIEDPAAFKSPASVRVGTATGTGAGPVVTVGTPTAGARVRVRLDKISRTIDDPQATPITERMDLDRSVSINYGDITSESYDQSGGKFERHVSPGRRSVASVEPEITIGNVTVQRYDANGQVITSSTVTDREVSPGEQRAGLTPLTYGSDGFTTVMNVVPRRATFDLPHPRQAAKFTIVVPYDVLPVDPRIVRAIGVEVHLGCVSADDYGAGMTGGRDRDGRSRSILSTRVELLDPSTGRPATSDSTLLFYGTADEAEVEHSDNGSTLTITGRSIIGIFLDGKPPPDALKSIDLTRPIHRVIADLIATIPIDARLTIDVMTDEHEWPDWKIPSPGTIEGFTNVRLGAADGQPKGGGGGGEKVSYWDLITNLCNFVGGIPVLEGSILWIRPGSSIFDVDLSPSRSPFRGERDAPEGKLVIRRLLLGQNVTKFKLKRTFGGTPVPIVYCYGLDDRATGKDRIVVGQWPPADSDAAKAKDDGETLRIPIAGVRDPARLTAIAHALFEEIGRGETGGEFETSRLASFGGGNADPDLLRLRPLEPVEILVDRSTGPTPIVSELTAREAQTFTQEVDALAARLGDRDLSRAIIASRRGAIVGILDKYRMTSVHFDVDAGTGIKVSGEIQNYIVLRHQAVEAEASKIRAVKVARATNPGQNRRPNKPKAPPRTGPVPLSAQPGLTGDVVNRRIRWRSAASMRDHPDPNYQDPIDQMDPQVDGPGTIF